MDGFPSVQGYFFAKKEVEEMEKQDFMRRAMALAKNGIGAVDPNPLVGAVIVKDGEIIGEGWHAERSGKLPHLP